MPERRTPVPVWLRNFLKVVVSPASFAQAGVSFAAIKSPRTGAAATMSGCVAESTLCVVAPLAACCSRGWNRAGARRQPERGTPLEQHLQAELNHARPGELVRGTGRAIASHFPAGWRRAIRRREAASATSHGAATKALYGGFLSRRREPPLRAPVTPWWKVPARASQRTFHTRHRSRPPCRHRPQQRRG